MTALIGFMAGFFVPLFSSRFPKFMPADAGTALAYMFHFPRLARLERRLLLKWGRLLCFCFLFGGIGASALFWLDYFGGSGLDVVALSCFSFLMLLLIHIDQQTMYLPDVLTVPLLILGFFFASDYQESALGALYGYLLPTIASALVARLRPDSFGGGDTKILAALGAWLGVMGLAFAIILSLIIFAVIALFKKKKSGPYGPSIGIAAFIVLAHQAQVTEIMNRIFGG